MASAISEARTRKTREEAGGGGADAPCDEEPTQARGRSSRPTIDYTLYPQAQADGIEGKFKARVTVDADGQVDGGRGRRGASTPALDAAVVAALKHWRFKPAMACGKPVAGGTFIVREDASSSATESDETRAPSLTSLWRSLRRLRSAASCRARAGRRAGPSVTKAPKLVKFVPADYPKDKHDAGSPASVLLSIEIGDDGKVGEVEVVKGAAPDFDAAAVAAAKQFVFEPAEIDDQPAPVKITYRYDFTIVEEIVKAGPQINFDGVVLERFKKRPLAARQGAHQRPRSGLTARHRRRRALRLHRRAARHAQGRAVAPQARHRDHRGGRSPTASGAR